MPHDSTADRDRARALSLQKKEPPPHFHFHSTFNRSNVPSLQVLAIIYNANPGNIINQFPVALAHLGERQPEAISLTTANFGFTTNASWRQPTTQTGRRNQGLPVCSFCLGFFLFLEMDLSVGVAKSS
ncbi:hypothetical protein K504DRAFT_186394 [Pleomassaria siparia CBS 279.74]|uniref:Uncharacterized protein n=1 Tax=Pleomassaria siparia CBS 279.74 TaxID=1314801 RepID=A0A6G1JQT5_9PLEO|nr:hypothetical protein K504DRAFT_186394 [Pleomassaria siparia CBS 279.74]